MLSRNLSHIGLWAFCSIIPFPVGAQDQSKKQPAVQAEKATRAKAPAQTSGTALDPVTRRVRRLADELRSPFCPGKTLMTCTSYQAFELRREMERLVRSGLSDDKIIAQLKDIHGDDISNPTQPWYTFFVPFLPFLVLAGLLFWIIRKWKRRGVDPDEGQNPMVEPGDGTDDDKERLERLRARVRRDDG